MTTASKGIPVRGKSAKQSTPAALQIRNVLVAIDFSAPSLEAIEAALPLIKHFGADLHLVHVFEPDYPLSSMAAIPLVVPELEIGQRVQRRLRDVAEDYSVPLRRENIHAMKGRPFEEICRLGQKIDIDLIVIATRGNTGLKHLVLGSTAERRRPLFTLSGSDRSRERFEKEIGTTAGDVSKDSRASRFFGLFDERTRVCQSLSQRVQG